MRYIRVLYILIIFTVSFVTCTSTDNKKDEPVVEEEKGTVQDTTSDIAVKEPADENREERAFPSQKELREAERLYIRAVKASKAGDKALAEEYLLKSLKLYPNYINALGTLALLYREQEDYDKAIEYYSRAVEIDSKDPLSRQNLAAIYMLQGKYEAAYTLYQELVEISNKSPEGYYGMGRVELYKKRYTKAIENLLEAEKLYSSNKSESIYDAQYLIGFAFYRLNDYENALTYFSRAYSAFEDYPELNYYMGISFLFQQERDSPAARIYIEKAKELGFDVPRKVFDYLGDN